MSYIVDVQYALDEGEENAGGLPAPRDFEQWVTAALQDRCDAGELTIRIVGLAEGMNLNQTYRHRQGPTNVLSFPAETTPDIEIPLLGDIVICAPVVEREAREQHKTPSAHWAHLTVHGVLHLLGYDHQQAREAEVMERLEGHILAGLGITDPYAEERAARAVS